MEDIIGYDALTPELADVTGVTDFQSSPPDILTVLREEFFNVIPVDGHSPIKPEIPADGGKAAQVAEVNGADGGPPRPSAPPPIHLSLPPPIKPYQNLENHLVSFLWL
jgi:hypothetical protein